MYEIVKCLYDEAVYNTFAAHTPDRYIEPGRVYETPQQTLFVMFQHDGSRDVEFVVWQKPE